MPLSQHGLLVIDMQNDFLEGGALAVPDSNAVLAPINALLQRDFAVALASKDWHPPNHVSFEAQGGPWPTHCIAGTKGAELSPSLAQHRLTHIIHKGIQQDCDSYSVFFDNARRRSTGVSGLLRDLGLKHLTLCGLALDVCVAASARDAIALGFNVTIELSACRAVSRDTQALIVALAQLGIHLKDEPLC